MPFRGALDEALGRPVAALERARSYGLLMLLGALMCELLLLANHGYERPRVEILLTHGLAACFAGSSVLVLRRPRMVDAGAEFCTCLLATCLVLMTWFRLGPMTPAQVALEVSTAGSWMGVVMVAAALVCRWPVAAAVGIAGPVAMALVVLLGADFGSGRIALRIASTGMSGLVCALTLFILVFVITRLRGAHARATTTAYRLQLQAGQDPLTGLLNRRGVATHLSEALARCGTGTGTGSTLTLIDVDRFKRINDEHGHLVGDEVLRQMARQLQRIVRPGEAAARWGGEEFLLLSQDATPDDTLQRIARLRASMRASEWPAGVDVRASFGVTAVLPHEPVDELIERADRALYRAKAGGRDRVEVAAR